MNVLYQDEETHTIMPLRVIKHRNRQHHVNVFLLYDDGVKKDGTEKPPTDPTTETPAEEATAESKYHYTLVRNLSALLRQDTKAGCTIHVCPYCLHIFYHNVKGYQTHLIDCENVMEEFYRHVQQEQNEIDFYLRTNLPMKPLTPEEQQRQDAAVECEQCHKPFENTRAMGKVRYHLHLTGKFAMSVCSSCNLQLKPRVRREFRERYFFDDDDDNESEHGNDNFVNDWCEYDDLLGEGGVPGILRMGGHPKLQKVTFSSPLSSTISTI